MPLQTYSQDDAIATVPAGEYVSAEVAQQLWQTLSRLVWTVLYGKAHDAAGLAVGAKQTLETLKAK